MPGVFISYSRADLGAVQPLERALQAHDIAVWRDEVFLSIDGERHYLWRAVDQDGHVLALLVQRPRDQKAAKTSFRKLLKGLTYVPRVIITDQLKSYGAAKREMLPSVDHRQHRYMNHRAEHSHQPTRQRERRRMQRFKSPGHAQPFLSAYGPIAQDFRPRRHRASVPESRYKGFSPPKPFFNRRIVSRWFLKFTSSRVSMSASPTRRP